MSMFQEFYDAGAEGYGVIFARVPEHFRATLLRQARVATGQTVLDVATGTGIVAETVAQIVGSSGSVIAVDISRGMLAVAERRLAPFQQRKPFCAYSARTRFPTAWPLCSHWRAGFG